MFGYEKRAFTLAEVLITLGIIGVIAALTIPTLVTNYQRSIWATRLKKVYSISANACERMLEEEHVDTTEETTLYSALNGNNSSGVETEYRKYFKVMNISGSTMFLPDSSTVTIEKQGSGFKFNVDVNGAKVPNEQGKDQFTYTFDSGCSLDRDNSDVCFKATIDNEWKIPEKCVVETKETEENQDLTQQENNNSEMHISKKFQGGDWSDFSNDNNSNKIWSD